jgi:putative transposase
MSQKAFKYRFNPTPEQDTLLRRTMGCTRLVYNSALSVRTEAWYTDKQRVGYNDTSAMLTLWKKNPELDYLNEVSCVPLQQGLRHLQKAFSNFFDGRAKYPNLKKKRNGGSVEFTKSAFKIRDGQVYLTKCSEPLSIRWSRTLPKGDPPSTITVKHSLAGRWTVSLLVDVEIELLPKSPKALSRKQKESNNRYKARLKLAKVHQEIVDAIKDFLHKLTTRLVRENQTIALEDLAVKKMVKNRKRDLSISDASWGELVKQLEYKCDWYDRTLIKIDRWFPSSQRCFDCGHIVEKLPLNIREWDCPKCRAHHDQDVNAALNILAAGLAVSVCGAKVRPNRVSLKGCCEIPVSGQKQKPK